MCVSSPRRTVCRLIALGCTVCESLHRGLLYAGHCTVTASLSVLSQGTYFVLHAFRLTNPNHNPNIFLLILIITLTKFSPNPNHNPDGFLLVLFVTLTSLFLLGFIKLRRLSWP